MESKTFNLGPKRSWSSSDLIAVLLLQNSAVLLSLLITQAVTR